MAKPAVSTPGRFLTPARLNKRPCGIASLHHAPNHLAGLSSRTALTSTRPRGVTQRGYPNASGSTLPRRPNPPPPGLLIRRRLGTALQYGCRFQPASRRTMPPTFAVNGERRRFHHRRRPFAVDLRREVGDRALSTMLG